MSVNKEKKQFINLKKELIINKIFDTYSDELITFLFERKLFIFDLFEMKNGSFVFYLKICST